MAKETYPMAKEGFAALEAEIQHLVSTRREQSKARFKRVTGTEFCDFREDSEYATSIKARELVEERIVTLKNMIQHAEIIEENKSTVVEMGSTVSFKGLPDGKVEMYKIVGVDEANPMSQSVYWVLKNEMKQRLR